MTSDAPSRVWPRRAVMLGGLAVGLSACSRPVDPDEPATDDTQRLNAELARGGDVTIAAGEYWVSVGQAATALVIERPGTHVTFAPGAVVRLHANADSGYSILRISAADCRVTGGRLIGDVEKHLGGDGEWGHGLSVSKGADRCHLEGVAVEDCWGDGFHVSGGVRDLVLSSCTSEGNRRQGLSIVDAVRPLITGGSYSYTGRHGHTSPAAGIDIEPNEGSRVVGARLVGVTMKGNRGAGLILSGHGRDLTATVENCSMVANSGAGALVSGVRKGAQLRSCTSTGNHRGFYVYHDSRGASLVRCTARTSLNEGFLVAGRDSILEACEAIEGDKSGFVVTKEAVGTQLLRCRGEGNGTAEEVADVDVSGLRTVVTSFESINRTPGRLTHAVHVHESARGTRATLAPGTSGFSGSQLLDERD